MGNTDHLDELQQDLPVSINEKFKELRLKKNFTISELSQEIHVTVQFIQGIEEKKYELLPALAYSLGLLTNMLEYLDVDVEKSKKLVKEFEEDFIKSGFLVRSHLKISKKLITINQSESENQESQGFSSYWILILIILILSVFIFFFQNRFNFLSNLNQESSQKESVSRRLNTFSLYSDNGTFSVGVGDQVKVFYQNKIVIFVVDSIEINAKPQVTLSYLDQMMTFNLYDSMEVNLDTEERKDLLIKFQQISGELVILYFSLIRPDSNIVNYEEIWNNQEKLEISGSEFFLLKNENKLAIVCFIKATTLPIHLTYNVDGQRQNIITLKPGSSFSILAQNHLEIQIGNYRSAQVVINRIPVRFVQSNDSHFGLTKIIKWVPSPNNETLFDLMVRDFIN